MQKKPLAKKLVLSIALCAFLISSVVLWLISEPLSAFRANLKDLMRKELIRIDLKLSKKIVAAIYTEKS